MAYRFLRYPGGKSKAVTFSYDDGCKSDMRLAETLDKYSIKCTFNLNSTKLFKGTDLTVEDAKQLIQNGHEIAIHGANHIACGIASPIAGIKDVITCRIELEKTLGTIIRGMAYPDTGITAFSNGTNYTTVKNYLTDLGIVYTRTLGGDNSRFELPTDWHAWMPSVHHSNPDIMKYINEFLSLDTENCYSAMRHPRLLYIWGHSFEFDCNNNWELLDQICHKLGNKENIWYATNTEIYNYVTAYNSLVWSADESRVYNPTLIEIHFNITGKDYTIKPGETLIIE